METDNNEKDGQRPRHHDDYPNCNGGEQPIAESWESVVFGDAPSIAPTIVSPTFLSDSPTPPAENASVPDAVLVVSASESDAAAGPGSPDQTSVPFSTLPPDAYETGPAHLDPKTGEITYPCPHCGKGHRVLGHGNRLWCDTCEVNQQQDAIDLAVVTPGDNLKLRYAHPPGTRKRPMDELPMPNPGQPLQVVLRNTHPLAVAVERQWRQLYPDQRIVLDMYGGLWRVSRYPNASPATIAAAYLLNYHKSGRVNSDNYFLRQLKKGPQERCFLGWGGQTVKVLRAYEGPVESILTRRSWIYVVESPESDFGWYNTSHHPAPPPKVFYSHEINFCDPDFLSDLLNSHEYFAVYAPEHDQTDPTKVYHPEPIITPPAAPTTDVDPHDPGPKHAAARGTASGRTTDHPTKVINAIVQEVILTSNPTVPAELEQKALDIIREIEAEPPPLAAKHRSQEKKLRTAIKAMFKPKPSAFPEQDMSLPSWTTPETMFAPPPSNEQYPQLPDVPEAAITRCLNHFAYHLTNDGDKIQELYSSKPVTLRDWQRYLRSTLTGPIQSSAKPYMGVDLAAPGTQDHTEITTDDVPNTLPVAHRCGDKIKPYPQTLCSAHKNNQDAEQNNLTIHDLIKMVEPQSPIEQVDAKVQELEKLLNEPQPPQVDTSPKAPQTCRDLETLLQAADEKFAYYVTSGSSAMDGEPYPARYFIKAGGEWANYRNGYGDHGRELRKQPYTPLPLPDARVLTTYEFITLDGYDHDFVHVDVYTQKVIRLQTLGQKRAWPLPRIRNFDAVYQELADQGKCDSMYGSQYQRFAADFLHTYGTLNAPDYVIRDFILDIPTCDQLLPKNYTAPTPTLKI